MIENIPQPAKERLLQIFRILKAKGTTCTSAELEELTGWTRNTIRKDISYLGRTDETQDDTSSAHSRAGTASGYSPQRLIPLIKEALSLNRRRTFCVVGLGRLGSAYLNLNSGILDEFDLAAGFDSNINRVEILKSPVPLYPSHKMGEVIQRFAIEIALLCVPAEAAQSTAEKLAAAGIRGILNFAPAAITVPKGIAVRNIHLNDELLALSIKIT